MLLAARAFGLQRQHLHGRVAFDKVSEWLRGRQHERKGFEPSISRTERPTGIGRCIWLEMGRGPKAGYRGGALQSRKPAAIRRDARQAHQ